MKRHAQPALQGRRGPRTPASQSCEDQQAREHEHTIPIPISALSGGQYLEPLPSCVRPGPRPSHLERHIGMTSRRST
jgi:hypothetical protein